MADYEKTTTVRLAPEDLFAYLSDIENLPRYMPFLERARPLGGDRVQVTAKGDPGADAGPSAEVTSEAWMRVVRDARKLAWGAPGADDYSGELDVDAGDEPGESRLTVRLHTGRDAHDDIERGITTTLEGLKRAVETAPPPG